MVEEGGEGLAATLQGVSADGEAGAAGADAQHVIISAPTLARQREDGPAVVAVAAAERGQLRVHDCGRAVQPDGGRPRRVGHRAAQRGRDGLGAERGVQRSVEVQTNEAEPGTRTGWLTGARDHELAIGLLDHAVGSVVSRANRQYQPAILTEVGVQLASDQEPDQAEVPAGAVAAAPRRQQLAIGLLDDAVGFVEAGANGDQDLAIAAKGSVQGAIGVQSDQTEVGFRAVDARSGNHQLAVGLLDHAVCNVDIRTDRHQHRAVVAEFRIRNAVLENSDKAEA